MNILLTAAGRRDYLVRYFREALQGRGQVIAANMSAGTPAMNEADQAVVVPASHKPGYGDYIATLCREREIGLICSLHDLDVLVLAQHRDKLAVAGAVPVLPSPKWAARCLDKYTCGQVLQKHGFQTPWAGISLIQVKEALARKQIGFPLLLKSRWGFGSMHQQKCWTMNELKVLYGHVARQLDNSVIAKFLPIPGSQSVLIQQFIDGDEFCLNVVNDLKGRYAGHFACRVEAMHNGESSEAITVDTAFLGDLPRRLGRLIGHRGIIGIDLIMAQGVARILDINPRFTGDYPFQHLAGANIPAALLAWAWGEHAAPIWLTPKCGVRGFKTLVPKRCPMQAKAEPKLSNAINQPHFQLDNALC